MGTASLPDLEGCVFDGPPFPATVPKTLPPPNHWCHSHGPHVPALSTFLSGQRTGGSGESREQGASRAPWRPGLFSDSPGYCASASCVCHTATLSPQLHRSSYSRKQAEPLLPGFCLVPPALILEKPPHHFAPSSPCHSLGVLLIGHH